MGADVFAAGSMSDTGAAGFVDLLGRDVVLGFGRGRGTFRDFKEQMMVTAEQIGCGTKAAYNATRGVVLATNVKTAVTMLDRRTGLLNREVFPVGEGLHLVPCDAIHTVGMQFPIDVLFLDENGIVLATWSDVQPGRRGIECFRAASALELPCCVIEATRTKRGEQITFSGVEC